MFAGWTPVVMVMVCVLQDEQASYDVNGHDPDPQPRYDYSNENRSVQTASHIVSSVRGH